MNCVVIFCPECACPFFLTYEKWCDGGMVRCANRGHQRTDAPQFGTPIPGCKNKINIGQSLIGTNKDLRLHPMKKTKWWIDLSVSNYVLGSSRM